MARDWRQAYAYYLKAAEQGHERAMNLLGRCCEEGWGTPRDARGRGRLVSAFGRGRLFSRPVQLGQLLLIEGRCDEAALWLERAAEGGTAAVRLAVLSLISRAQAPGALNDLAARLKASVFA